MAGAARLPGQPKGHRIADAGAAEGVMALKAGVVPGTTGISPCRLWIPGCYLSLVGSEHPVAVLVGRDAVPASRDADPIDNSFGYEQVH